MHDAIGSGYERCRRIDLRCGQGSRLFPLTQFRSKPAVPIGGKYRLIDNPISNCIHSGINRIFVLTQFNSASLHRHISTTYRFDSFSDGFVEIMAAEQTQDSADWYQGTADAVRQQLRHLLSRKSTTKGRSSIFAKSHRAMPNSMSCASTKRRANPPMSYTWLLWASTFLSHRYSSAC